MYPLLEPKRSKGTKPRVTHTALVKLNVSQNKEEYGILSCRESKYRQGTRMPREGEAGE